MTRCAHHPARRGQPAVGLARQPSVITDYRGFTALAYHVGSATGSDGRRYDLETDIRAMELPPDAFRVSHDGRKATFEAKDVCLVNSFQFLGPNNVAAKVSFKLRWEATGPAVRRGRGAEVPPTDRGYALMGRERNGVFLTG